MELMCYQSSTWDPLDSLQPELSFYGPENQSEVTDALLGFFSDSSEASHLPIDSLFNPLDDQFYNHEDYFMLPTYNHHPSLSAPSFLSLPPDLYSPSEEFDICQSRKRPRSCNDLYHSSDQFILDDNSCSGLLPAVVAPATNNFHVPGVVSEFVTQPLNAAVPMPLCNGERKGSSECLSAQSIAARERRKRISEKTQELGRLIPGGNKMNTAEMFQAAYKYVKFMQAQIAVFKLMDQVSEIPEQVQERLQILVSSTVMQEKLSGEGKCVIPKEAVESLAKDKEITSNMFVSRDLDRFIESLE